MKYLTIIRHAKSSWENHNLEDISRPLNERGKQAIGLIGKYLKKKGLRPGLILSSPATRAKETALGLSSFVHYPPEKIKIEQLIYHGTVKDISQLVQEINNKFNDVFLFGHEPILSSLIYRYSGEALIKFSTCAAYRITFDTDQWEETDTVAGKCEFFVYPKLLLKE